ncbi:hypothetical protein BKD83_02495 [Corynebacterium diphtheriae]|nr:hypothetical protein BKD83_02495 [Corynebacterium diphtheriae]
MGFFRIFPAIHPTKHKTIPSIEPNSRIFLKREDLVHGDAPILLGFGISTPEHVRDAIAAGASGAITDTHPAPVQVTDLEALTEEIFAFVKEIKAATR